MFTCARTFWTWLTASRSRFSFACALAVVGLLLWSRLILVSNMPRTAIAEDETPGARAPEEGPSDKAAPGSAQAGATDDPNAEPRTEPR